MLPIVLHHGLFGMGNIQVGPVTLRYFNGIDKALELRGHRVLTTQVHPCASIALRAGQLKEQLSTQFAAHERIIIIAHSMGGLDARYMIRHLDMHGRVAALVTITTPHRGSTYADWCVKHLGDRLGGFALFATLGIDVAGVRELTTEACRRFNDQTLDHPDVRYYSVSCARPWNLVPAWGMLSHRIIADLEGENDAQVSVRSAIWANHLQTWPADHWHAVNHRFVVEIKNPTGDIAPYYSRIMDAINSSNLV